MRQSMVVSPARSWTRAGSETVATEGVRGAREVARLAAPYARAMASFLGCRPNLEVTDLGPTVSFLRDTLGFGVELEDDSMGFAVLRRDHVTVAVVRTSHPGVNETTAFYLMVTDVEGWHDRCCSSSALAVLPLTDHPWGLRDFVVEIPGGHRLAVGQQIT
jgi:hypothetical protein